MKDKGIRLDSPEYESSRQEKYVSKAAELFVMEVQLVQQAMERLNA